MSGKRIWIERLAQCEVEGATFMLALESGDETLSIAMTPHIARKLCERMRLAITEWQSCQVSIASLAESQTASSGT